MDVSKGVHHVFPTLISSKTLVTENADHGLFFINLQTVWAVLLIVSITAYVVLEFVEADLYPVAFWLVLNLQWQLALPLCLLHQKITCPFRHLYKCKRISR